MIGGLWAPDAQADRVVPPSGANARLTLFASAVMAFLAVFSLALALAAARLADRWESEMAQSATLRIVAPAEQMDEQTALALDLLRTTTGVGDARALSAAEQQALLAPWFGADLSLDALPVPQLIEIRTDADFDAAGLRLRLAGEVPGAVLDDHGRWRAPLIRAANRLRWLGWGTAGLILATVAAVVTLAANASLAANAQVIAVLRLVGATDTYIARAFVRRFTLRTLIGATGGAVLGGAAIALIADRGENAGLLTGFGFQGLEWAMLFPLPLVTAAVALFATGLAADRALKGLS